MTNFEKIKNMTVDEMIMLICYNYKCRKCVQYHRQECDGYCYDGIKQWLESEVQGSDEMTIEEAIRLLDPKTTGEAIAEIEYYNGFSGKTAAIQAITAACEIAVEAMGKQVAKKVRLKSNIACCECGEKAKRWYYYCPDCGQALD